MGAFAGAAYGIAKQLFLVRYRSQIEASINTCLRIKSPTSFWPQGFVIPGCVIKVLLRDGSQSMFDMYLTRVTHTINCETHQAYTQWVGAYCRPEDGIVAGGNAIVSPGQYNPMYLPS